MAMTTRLTLILLTLLWACPEANGQERPTRYTVAFYNVENLFDTIKAPGVMDEEFTPMGSKKWTTARYNDKIKQLSDAIYALSFATRGYPIAIGLAEVENRTVVEELVRRPKLARADYQVVHYDSPDARGVDVAFIYRPDKFKYEGSIPIPIIIPAQQGYKTRDILSVWGTIDSERFCFMVCQWPSRRGGKEQSEFRRMGAAATIKHAVDSILKAKPGTKVVIMGTLNDNPADNSVKNVLGAAQTATPSSNMPFFSSFFEAYQKQQGSAAYNNIWETFDNIIVNGALAVGQPGRLGLVRVDDKSPYGNIFSRPFLLETSGPYTGKPRRTYTGNTYIGGASGHLPIYIMIGK